MAGEQQQRNQNKHQIRELEIDKTTTPTQGGQEKKWFLPSERLKCFGYIGIRTFPRVRYIEILLIGQNKRHNKQQQQQQQERATCNKTITSGRIMYTLRKTTTIVLAKTSSNHKFHGRTSTVTQQGGTGHWMVIQDHDLFGATGCLFSGVLQCHTSIHWVKIGLYSKKKSKKK